MEAFTEDLLPNEHEIGDGTTGSWILGQVQFGLGTSEALSVAEIEKSDHRLG